MRKTRPRWLTFDCCWRCRSSPSLVPRPPPGPGAPSQAWSSDSARAWAWSPAAQASWATAARSPPPPVWSGTATKRSWWPGRWQATAWLSSHSSVKTNTHRIHPVGHSSEHLPLPWKISPRTPASGNPVRVTGVRVSFCAVVSLCCRGLALR